MFTHSIHKLLTSGLLMLALVPAASHAAEAFAVEEASIGDIQRAIADMESGDTIKPVLVFD